MKSLNKLLNYDFHLPKELIAQKAISPPDKCRLLVLDKKTKKVTDDRFLNLPNYLQKGDVLVFNNSKVIPARLIGFKKTGGKVEILLLRQIKPNIWECLVGNLPIKKQAGTTLYFNQKNAARPTPSPRRSLTKDLTGKILSRAANTAQIKFNLSGTKLMKQILKIGQTPTPPYIKRIAKSREYQTFFAKKLGSVAAPTAGLHFTPRMFKKLSAKGGSASGGKQKGVQIEFITLHVGFGTFQPIKESDVRKHKMHAEYFELDKQTASRLNQAKKEGRRIIAVGTTTVRVLESCASLRCHPEPVEGSSEGEQNKIATLRQAQCDNFIQAQSGFTKIYIYPGYRFKFVNAMITNFHLPKSSLLLLVSAFAGTNFIKKAYHYAIRKKYCFYSFGDVMLIK